MVGEFNSEMLILVFVIILSAMIIHFIVNKKRDIFDPFYIISMIYMLVFSVAPYTWLKEGKLDWYGIPVMNGLFRGTILFILGYCGFIFGYIITKPKKFDNNIDISFDMRKKIIKLSRLFFWISFIFVVIYFASIGKGITFLLTLGRSNDLLINVNSNVSASASFFLLFSYIMPSMWLTMYAFKSRITIRMVVEFIITLAILTTIGFRFIILIFVISIIIFNYIKRGKRPKLFGVIKLGLVAFLLVSVIGFWRRSIRSGQSLQAFNFGDLWSELMYNFDVFFPFYNLVELVPNHYPYQLGKSYIAIFTQFIPRFLWENKPIPPVIALMKAMYGSYYTSGPAYPNIGEFYLDFGAIGIVLGMILFGIIAKKSYGLIEDTDNTFNLILYSLLLPFWLQYITRGYLTQILQGALFILGPIVLIKLIISSKYLIKK